jgi:hypothetical protein
MRPKRNAPSGRIASVSVIAQLTARLLVANAAAISRSTNTMMKKSNASSVQPR